jgi:hypothetical protein
VSLDHSDESAPRTQIPMDNGPMADELDEGIIYIGYGDLMRKLQLMELNLWQIQAPRPTSWRPD